MKTAFGWISISGTRYEKDVIIHADSTVSKRRKKLSKDKKAGYGHTPLSKAELDFLADEKPKVVFVGTGQSGALPITPGARSLLEKYDVVIGPTPDILPRLEEERRKKVAILHITC